MLKELSKTPAELQEQFIRAAGACTHAIMALSEKCAIGKSGDFRRRVEQFANLMNGVLDRTK